MSRRRAAPADPKLAVAYVRMSFHTNLAQMFAAMGNQQRELRWLLTAYECNHLVKGFPLDLSATPCLLSGDEIPSLAATPDAPQFIWGVLSGFPPGTRIDLDHLPVVPWADGNEAIWDPSGRPQYPGARVQIVCFDSTGTVVTSDDEELHRHLRAYFPEAVPMRARPARS